MLTFIAILFLMEGTIATYKAIGAYWLAAAVTLIVLMFKPLRKPSTERTEKEQGLPIIGWVVVATLVIGVGAASDYQWLWVFGIVLVLTAGAVLDHDVIESDNSAAQAKSQTDFDLVSVEQPHSLESRHHE